MKLLAASYLEASTIHAVHGLSLEFARCVHRHSIPLRIPNVAVAIHISIAAGNDSY